MYKIYTFRNKINNYNKGVYSFVANSIEGAIKAAKNTK